MAGIESQASFRARALEISVREAVIDELVASGIDTFGKLAYICANPNSGDDAPLQLALRDRLTDDPTDADMVTLRRLWFESFTLRLGDLKARVERAPSDTPRQLPLAERLARLAD